MSPYFRSARYPYILNVPDLLLSWHQISWSGGKIIDISRITNIRKCRTIVENLVVEQD